MAEDPEELVKLRVRVRRLEQLLESAHAMVVRLHGERESLIKRVTEALLGVTLGVNTTALLLAMLDRWQGAVSVLEGTGSLGDAHAERLRLCMADLYLVLRQPLGPHTAPTAQAMAALEEALAQEPNS